MADPKFVRLRTGLNGRYDLRSGWGISGLDVKHMPDKDERPRAHAYVKGELNAGRLEGASKAEYDETQVDITSDGEGNQERSIQARAKIQRSKILASRSGTEESAAADADEARRKAILKQQGKAGKGKAAAEDDDDDDDDGDQYDSMNKQALVNEANGRDVDSSGTAEDIRGRLRAADEDGDGDEDEDSDDDSDDDESDDDESEDDDNTQS